MDCPKCDSFDVDELEITDNYDRPLYSEFTCEDCYYEWNNKAVPYVYKKVGSVLTHIAK